MARPKGAKTKNRKQPKSGGAKGWSLTERERVKEKIQRWDLHGYNRHDIVRKLGEEKPPVVLSVTTVGNILQEIQKDYQDAYVDNRKMMVMRATAAHLDNIREAQEQIARIKARGKRKVVRESGDNEKGGFSKTATTREDGDIGGYLTIITNNWTRIAQLHGLEELPKQVFNLQVNNNTVNVFDQLMQAMLGDAKGTEGNSGILDTPAIEDKPS